MADPRRAGSGEPWSEQQKRIAEVALAALDHMVVGIALLDEDGRVLHLNRAATSLIDKDDGLAVAQGCLVTRGTCDCRLHNAVARGTGTAFLLPRRSGCSDYLVVVAPGPHSRIVFVAAPEARPASREIVLHQMWRLTAAEIRVALALLDGLSPKEIAKRDRVSQPTVRSQIRSILTKTGTTRQGEFLRLASTIVFGLSSFAGSDERS